MAIKKKKKEKKPTYHKILTKAEGYKVYIDDINRLVQGVIFNGSVDGSMYWTMAGQLLLTEDDVAAMFNLPTFTIRAHKYRDNQEYVLRLLDCSLQPGSDGLLDITRVIFWRPKNMDVEQPRWKPTLNLDNC